MEKINEAKKANTRRLALYSAGLMLLLLVAVGLLLPAFSGVRSGGKSKPANDLTNIVLAFHSLQKQTGVLPSNSYDADGKPLLSWRVHILPEIEQQALYEQFRLDEPWSSDHNLKLVNQMPSIYRAEKAAGKSNRTPYQVFSGKGTAFESGKAIAYMEISDRLIDTIAIVEAPLDDAVIWTKPADIPFEAEAFIAALALSDRQGFNAAFFDGSVHWIPKTLSPKHLQAFITPNGGEKVKFEDVADWLRST